MAKNFINKNNRAYGIDNPTAQIPYLPIVSQRAPTSSDIAEIGRTWVDVPNQDSYTAVARVSGAMVWIKSGAAEGDFTELIVTPGVFTYTGVGSAFTMTSDTASSIGVTGAGIDLTLSSAAGRIIVNGEEAAANAITLLSAAGGIDADAALQINIDSSQAAAADSIRIVASAADGGIDIDCGTGGATLDSTGGISIDAATASNFTAAAGDLSLVATAGSAIVSGGEAVIDGVQLTSVGGITATSGALAATTGLHVTQGAATAAVQVGAGAPAHDAPKGSLYLRTDGSTTNDRAYINTDGAGTWTALTTVA